MLLSDLKKYLFQKKAANMLELSMHLQSDPDVVRAMISHWIRKGCVRQSLKTSACGTLCGKCNPLLTEIYQWQDVQS